MHSFSQAPINWHYLSTYPTNTSSVVTYATETYLQNIYNEAGVAFHSEIIDVEGSFISRNSLAYADSYYFDEVIGFASDNNQGAYVWGFSYFEAVPDYYFVAHLNMEMEVDWMHTYNDSVRLHPGSVIQNDNEVYVIGTSAYEIKVFTYVDGLLTNECGFTHINAGDLDGTTISYSGVDSETGAVSIFNEWYDSLLVYTLDADCLFTKTYIDDIPPITVFAGYNNFKLLYTNEHNRLYSCFKKDMSGHNYQIITYIDPSGSLLWKTETEINADVLLYAKLFPYNDDTFLNCYTYSIDGLNYIITQRIQYSGEILDSHTTLLQDYFPVEHQTALTYDASTKRIIISLSDIAIPDRSGIVSYDVEDGLTDTCTIPYNYTPLAQFNDILYGADNMAYIITMHKDAALTDYLEITQLGDLESSITPENKVQSITIYPNPTTSTIHLNIPIAKHFSYQIIDLTGNKMLAGTCNNSTIEIASLPAGLYQVVVTTGDVMYCGWVEKM